MNTRIRVMCLFSVVVILIGGCRSAGQCDPDYVTRSRNTFTVATTGSDDTANLQCAFDAAVAAGPGSTVQLASGTYSIGMIEVEGFQGSFVGAGKEQTTITALPDLDCPDGWPELVTFRGGDIRVADLTFDISDPHPCQPWEHPSMGTRDELAGIVRISGRPYDPSYDWSNPIPDEVSSSFENVGFRGSMHSGPYPWGVTFALDIAGGEELTSAGLGRIKPLMGVHTVANCSFENSFWAIGAYGLESSSVLVGGSGSKGNSFANVRFGLWTMDNSSSTIEFSYNEVVDVAPDGVGILSEQTDRPMLLGFPWPSPSDYLIRHNTIRVSGPVHAIEIVDDGPRLGKPKTVHAEVSNNQITLEGRRCGGIWGSGAQEVLVASNEIAGSGLAGIYFDQQGFRSSGWTITDNDVQHLDASKARIWLGRHSSNCTVEGRNAEEDVLDEGTDNTIVDVN